jgi:hypothetical protein
MASVCAGACRCAHPATHRRAGPAVGRAAAGALVGKAAQNWMVDTESPARIERSSTDLPPRVGARLETLDAVIVPGVPGMTAERMGLEPEEAVFPSTTTDVMKVLREQSVQVEFEDPDAAHPLITHKAAEYWIPVAIFIETGAAHAAGDLMARAIVSFLGRRRADKSLLHVKLGRVTRGRTKIEWLEAHGKGADVLKAMREFRE